MKKNILFFSSLTIGIFAWELAAFFVGSIYFPHSWNIANDLFKLIRELNFWIQFLETIAISTFGVIVGTLLALITGVLISITKNAEKSTQGTINMFVIIPSIVFLPILISGIGSNTKTVLILSTSVVFFRMITYITRAIKDIENSLLDSARLLKLNLLMKFVYIYCPAIFSKVSVGFRYTTSIAFGTVVTAGIAAGTPGFGSALYLAETVADFSRVFSYVFVMGIIGVAINNSLSKIEIRLLHWK